MRSRATEERYERTRPGELLHVDVKKLGRIPDGGGNGDDEEPVDPILEIAIGSGHRVAGDPRCRPAAAR